nr:malate dehydrogenase, chloroplastic-like [Tanacetum cinerariifolium]
METKEVEKSVRSSLHALDEDTDVYECSFVQSELTKLTFFASRIQLGKQGVEDFQDSHDDDEDTRSSQEYLNDLEEEYQARALLAKSKRFFKKVPSYQSPFQPKPLSSSQDKPELRPTKDFEAKYNKVKAKLALLSSSALVFKASMVKNKCLIAESYEWDEEEVSSDDNEMMEVKVLMALAEDNDVVALARGNKSASALKVNSASAASALQVLRRLGINFTSVYAVVQKMKKDSPNIQFSTVENFQHVNTEILKENQKLRNDLKELTSITKAWLNSSNKVNYCIGEQIPTQKKKILGINQLTKDTSSSRPKDPVFVKSSADNLEVSITGCNKPKLVEAEDSTLSNHDTGRPKTIKSILKSKSTFKAKTLKGITINEPSLAPARGNKSSLVSKSNSAPAGKLKNMKIEDYPPLAIVMKELNEIKLQISKNKSSYFRNKNSQQIISLRKGIKPRNPQHITKNYETCGSNVHTTSDHNDIEWFRKKEALQANKVESFKASKTESSGALRSKTPTK